MNSIGITLLHKTGLTQRVAMADLLAGGIEVFHSFGDLDVIYSDPPWSPGNEKWWRRHVGERPPVSYDNLLDAWCRCAAASSVTHIFCEQSIIDRHRDMLLKAVERCGTWHLPFLEMWTVRYGSPKRDNILLHFGTDKLDADPSRMGGEAMTRLVLQGLGLPAFSTIGDPCMGFGMTSRIAHGLGCHFIGTELSAKRLSRAVSWLKARGYTEQ